MQHKKDKVLAKLIFDASMFVGKRYMMSDLTFGKDNKLTIESSITLQPRSTVAGGTDESSMSDLYFNESSSVSDESLSPGTNQKTRSQTTISTQS